MNDLNTPFHLVRRDGNRTAARQRLDQQKLPPSLRDFKLSAEHFQLSDGLETALNMALAVGAPLLLTGEPGTGKTQVAYFLSWYFDIPIFDYQVRSTSTADDMKYDFDAVAYLRAAHDPNEPKRDREKFLHHKALWLAYDCKSRSVLLIDEIDKAPRDFPNDLLQELDKHEFQHPFAKTKVTPVAGKPPIVIITSNEERRLPDAFLRRCIFHRIELTKDLVHAAVSARTGAGDFPHLDDATRREAVERFWDIYRNNRISKKPSTAEILVWLAILSARNTRREELENRNLKELPAITALIKDKGDLDRL